MLQPDALLNDRYRIIEPIGEGGMATVYRALDTKLGRNVAIKVLHPEYERDQPFLQRFQQEAEFAASLGAHPNIVDIYDIGQDGTLHYIVMEYVEGPTLKELIRQRHQFGVPEAFSIGAQVASALAFAHKRGLVHRDVKPQNILVTPDGQARVTDFGIARSVTTTQLTRTGMVIGTVHYFSPEQAQGKPLGPESDIYSLGIILYEMLTGHLPFDAENAIGVAMQHIHSEPPNPWDYNPDLPARAVSTVMRALAKDPEDRYRDATEFASALASQAGGGSGTTTIAPLVTAPRTETSVYRTVAPEAPAPAQRVVAAPAPRPSSVTTTSTGGPSRTLWMMIPALLLVIALAVGSFFAASHFSGGGPPPTKTPRPTARPTKTPKKATPKPTKVIPVIVPTAIPTAFPTLAPPAPTSTPRPKPRPTRVPPTAAPPTSVPTIVTVGPVPTWTPEG